MRFPSTNAVKIAVKWANGYDYYHADGGEWVPELWLHLIFTWAPGNGTRAYLNGCDLDPDDDKAYAYSTPRASGVTKSYPFLVGSGILNYEDYKGTIIDEFYMWYEMLSPHQIWQLYIRGRTRP